MGAGGGVCAKAGWVSAAARKDAARNAKQAWTKRMVAPGGKCGP